MCHQKQLQCYVTPSTTPSAISSTTKPSTTFTTIPSTTALSTSTAGQPQTSPTTSASSCNPNYLTPTIVGAITSLVCAITCLELFLKSMICLWLNSSLSVDSFTLKLLPNPKTPLKLFANANTLSSFVTFNILLPLSQQFSKNIEVWFHS